MLEYTLTNDGSMDTVVEYYCPRCKRTWEERFNGELAIDYRDPDTGAMHDLDGFLEPFDIDCECEEDSE